MTGGTITLPWPPKELSPNARKHWRVKALYVKQYRSLCWGMTLEQLGRATGYRVTSITFCPPDRRKRDDDGMIGSFKAGRDGVADALGVDDNKFRPSYHFGDPVKNGAVIVTVEAA